MSILALVLVLLGVAAALLVPVGWRRLPRPARRTLPWVALGTAVVGAALTVPAALVPDAVDRLPRHDRAAVRRALRHAPGCWRTSRVTEIRPSTDRSARHGFSYTCSWTILGWPSVSGEATCADGSWTLPGYLEPRFTLDPCGHATDERRGLSG